MSQRVVVVSAGLTIPSSTRLLADRLADAVTAQVTARGEAVEVEVIEVREHGGDLATFMTSAGVVTPTLARIRDQISAADGLIAVTPVFSASYSGLFKMFFDALDPDSLTGMPVLMGATAGTARHSLVLEHAMRPLFAYLRAVLTPTAVFAATEDFASTGLSERIARAAAEFATSMLSQDDYAVGGFGPDRAARPRRTVGKRLDVENLTPFSALLEGHSG